VADVLGLADDGVWDWLTHEGVVIVVVLVTAIVVSWLSGVLVRHTRVRLESATTATETASRQRQATVTRILTNGIRAVIWAVATILILTQFHIDVGRILFGAGLVSLAVAFGAQHFIHDVVNGIFILTEKQYAVGDLVTLRLEGGLQLEGWIQNVTFRSTELQLGEGMTEIVSNGKIVSALNRSRGRRRLQLEVRVPHDADAERVREELDRTLHEVQQDRRVAGTFYTGPHLDRRQSDGAEFVTISVETRPDTRDEVERALRRVLDRRLHPIDDRIEVRELDAEAA
jgi:moderate conductance mechanosensitive channel